MSSNNEYLLKKFQFHCKGLIRYRKEYLSYEKQYDSEYKKLQELKNKGEINKQFENSVQETKDMFPILKKKMLEHIEQTKEFLYELEEIEEKDLTIKEDDRYIIGKETLDESEKFIENILNKIY